jgi:abortive infection bacteriophage resistance protein
MIKPPTLISEQIRILKSRNLIIEDEAKAGDILLKYNYYRLAGYWQKYKINPYNNYFKNNITFEQIIAIYELDMLLKGLLQQGIGIFEVCFRTRFAYHTAHLNGGYSYLKPDSYIMNNEKPGEFIKEIWDEMNHSKDKSIKHDMQIYDHLPIWAAVETLNFSTLSKMYSYWADETAIYNISNSFKIFQNLETLGFDTLSKLYSFLTDALQSISGFETIRNREILRYTIHFLVELRNLCAHQSRIWNRTIMIPRNNLEGQAKDLNKISPWEIISVLTALVDEIIIKKDESFSTRVKKLCESNKEFFNGLTDPTF